MENQEWDRGVGGRTSSQYGRDELRGEGGGCKQVEGGERAGNRVLELESHSQDLL